MTEKTIQCTRIDNCQIYKLYQEADLKGRRRTGEIFFEGIKEPSYSCRIKNLVFINNPDAMPNCDIIETLNKLEEILKTLYKRT
jgi:hypothetical protein